MNQLFGIRPKMAGNAVAVGIKHLRAAIAGNVGNNRCRCIDKGAGDSLEDARADYQSFNVGGDRKVSVLDYAQLIAQRAGLAIQPEIPGLYRFGDTRHVFSDVSKLRALGWEPTVSLEEIVDGYIAWAQAQPGFRDYYAKAEAQMQAMGTLRRTQEQL